MKYDAGPASAQQVLSAIEDAIGAVPFPICIYDQDDTLLACSDAFRDAAGAIFEGVGPHAYEHSLKYEDIVRCRLSKQFPEDEVPARLMAEMKRHRVQDEMSVDMLMDGQWMRRSRIASKDGNLIAIALPIDEIVERTAALSRAKREMEHQAYHDPLTDLPNRRALNEYLSRVFDSDMMLDDVAVFHVDLDKFKLINDTMGHDAGDSVLLEAAKILRSEVRATDFVARVGGDEFVLVFTSLIDRENIANVAQRIVDKMSQPIYYDDQPCQIGASIGIAMREAFTTPERIIMDADIALYEAKLAGRGRYSFYHAGHRAKHVAFKRRVLEVREAIQLNAFEPFFQPQICSNTGEIIGFEALARWRDREKGIRPPSEFLGAIDEANLLFELDEMIIRKALRRLSDWDADGVSVPMVSANLSTGILMKENLTDHLKWMCDAAEIAPERLGLEVLENVVVDDQNGVISQNVRQLKAAGFLISLDDFGTGNASISSLRSLAPHRIKLAQEFVTGIHCDEGLQTIATAIIGLAQSLGMQILCEGVEGEQDRKVLEAMGCDYFQGFLFAKPMEDIAVPIWIDDYYEDTGYTLKRA